MRLASFALLPVPYLAIGSAMAFLVLALVPFSQPKSAQSFPMTLFTAFSITHGIALFVSSAIYHGDQFWCWSSQIWLAYMFLTRAECMSWTKIAHSGLPYVLQLLPLWRSERYHVALFNTHPMQRYPVGGFVLLWSLVALTYAWSNFSLLKPLCQVSQALSIRRWVVGRKEAHRRPTCLFRG
jgi:hypothetical protein